MGIDANAARFLLSSKAAGTRFTRTATLGRQWLLLSAGQLERLFDRFGDPLAPGEAHRILTASDGFAEPFFERLGAQQVDAIDATDYEGATVLHDMNEPLPSSLEGQYTAVVDGGTLEHVFDVATAIKGMMSLVAVGGRLLSMVPANNNLGHGFYQFSPELFFRVLSPEHGFEMERLLLAEWDRDRWYDVSDPATLGRRVELCNRRDTYLYSRARRVGDVAFEATPMQSDYASTWEGEARPAPTGVGDRIVSRIRTGVPRPVRVAGRRLVGDGLRNGWWIGVRSGSFRRVHLDAEAREQRTSS